MHPPFWGHTTRLHTSQIVQPVAPRRQYGPVHAVVNREQSLERRCNGHERLVSFNNIYIAFCHSIPAMFAATLIEDPIVACDIPGYGYALMKQSELDTFYVPHYCEKALQSNEITHLTRYSRHPVPVKQLCKLTKDGWKLKGDQFPTAEQIHKLLNSRREEWDRASFNRWTDETEEIKNRNQYFELQNTYSTERVMATKGKGCFPFSEKMTLRTCWVRSCPFG